jgi:hypothetical protein
VCKLLYDISQIYDVPFICYSVYLVSETTELATLKFCCGYHIKADRYTICTVTSTVPIIDAAFYICGFRMVLNVNGLFS